MVEGDRLIQRVYTEGLNPYFHTRKEISRSIRLNLPESFFRRKIGRIYFYGAGCTTFEKKEVVKASLIAQFKTPTEVESDLLAAARGLFGNEAGIACILGTGSNSCFYDGKHIAKHVRPAGYILGDEGSESVFGKFFLSDLLKEMAPPEVSKDFYEKLHITPDDVMKTVYEDPSPTRFLVSVASFLMEHLKNKYVYDLLCQNLRDFFVRNVCRYENFMEHRIRFVGSGAHTYPDILREIAQEFGIKVDMIKDSSILGLIRYHALNDPIPD